eukprot:CAMPEP_0184368716 /NCGR_PEP_ID=MMETSP1089-20130417/161821_1 /TAXON_ID=38269 ORGANISM="Gloeochaete wittrockiana, Strain SAG46.84" /NCGR_SAMPLE_ID=MMETSP1089 /ASSEMBLY_ACC=CAM_ASM_000445 /LENGTH=1040 /DNA_ID=CAMNT_0026711049 /DNA_START=361 /DNA_END=3483 /DNA_ORIENTATION=+
MATFYSRTESIGRDSLQNAPPTVGPAVNTDSSMGIRGMAGFLNGGPHVPINPQFPHGVPTPPGFQNAAPGVVGALYSKIRRKPSMRSLNSRKTDEEFLAVESLEAIAEFEAEREDQTESKESIRLRESESRTVAHWYRWGPYLSERQWGTVREDYTSGGEAWSSLSHAQARSKAYRSGEDGLAGFSDRNALICFSIGLWNGKDPILKERLFGLTNNEGNHGEDVKEYYWYLDSTPTHSYMKLLYKYPQSEYPYARLVEENRKRNAHDSEFELLDTGIFNEDRYFDVEVEYAKADPDDICIRVTITNRGPDKAFCAVLPQIWLSSWASFLDREDESKNGESKNPGKPHINKFDDSCVRVEGIAKYGSRWLWYEGGDELLFTDNETNYPRLYNTKSDHKYFKDAFHEYVCHKNEGAVNHDMTGTKATRVHRLDIEPGQSKVVKCRLVDHEITHGEAFETFDNVFADRIADADEFYKEITPSLSDDDARIQRQAFAGLLWSKQFYYYGVREWLTGDPGMPKPPSERWNGRNSSWEHLAAQDVISMPDKWEYPWFAAWDLAFHCVPLAMVDANFAKRQLLLLVRESYQHPNGMIPAYEWNFGDVNPPVHAWATWRVYKMDQKRTGKADRVFLRRVFVKLLLNFTWWVNRKDVDGRNLFEGGFLGLDNIGVFDRNMKLPDGMSLEQSDATAWMAMYCLNMLSIALELALTDSAYEDLATKFFEHFVYIADSFNRGQNGCGLWDEKDGFYYDAIRHSGGNNQQLRVRSLVGLLPCLAVITLEPDVLAQFPNFRKRMAWFIKKRPDLVHSINFTYVPDSTNRRAPPKERILLSLVPRARLTRVLTHLFDENEFLSPFGIRSLSKWHKDHPYEFKVGNDQYSIRYEPGESSSRMFGGNSNWRGPIWFPVNYLLLEALQHYDFYFQDTLKVDFPTGSDNQMSLWDCSLEISKRLLGVFREDGGNNQRRPVFGNADRFQKDPSSTWHNPLFYEYFHGDSGCGLGASHQTGWTALVCKIMDQLGRSDANADRAKQLKLSSLTLHPVAEVAE